METMKNIVVRMLEMASEERNFDLAQITRDLIDELSSTYNVPSNWRAIGEEIAAEYKGNDWICEALQLWNYEE